MGNNGLDNDTFGTGNSEWKPEGYNMYSAPQEPYSMPTENTYNYTAPNEPYSMPYNEPVATQKESKALEICALVFGILGLVGCACCGIFGIVGLILSIVCLVKGKKSGMTIAGLICSIIGVLLSIIFAIYFAYNGELSTELTGFGDDNPIVDDQTTEDKDDDNKIHSSKDNSDKDKDATTEDDTDSSDNKYSYTGGYNEATDTSCVQVELYGKTYTLPCKFSEIKDAVEIDEYDMDYYKDGIEADDYAWLDLVEGDDSTGVTIGLYNDTDSKIKNLDDAIVMSVEEYDYDDGEGSSVAVFLGGLKIGMTRDEVEKFLEQYKEVYYSGTDDSDYYAIDIKPSEDVYCTYSFFVSKDTDKVSSIDFSVFQY